MLPFVSLQSEPALKQAKKVVFSRELIQIRYFRTEEPSALVNIKRHEEPLKLLENYSSAPKVHYSIRSSLCQLKSMQSLIEKLMKNNLVMDSVKLRYPFLDGYIAVKNISFHKRVFLRYTTNNWQSSQDLAATYDSSSAIASMDKFLFVLDASKFFSDESTNTLLFAICFESEGVQYWDNNDGANYRVDFIQHKSQHSPEKSILQPYSQSQPQSSQFTSNLKQTTSSSSSSSSHSQQTISQPQRETQPQSQSQPQSQTLISGNERFGSMNRYFYPPTTRSNIGIFLQPSPISV